MGAVDEGKASFPSVLLAEMFTVLHNTDGRRTEALTYCSYEYRSYVLSSVAARKHGLSFGEGHH